MSKKKNAAPDIKFNNLTVKLDINKITTMGKSKFVKKDVTESIAINNDGVDKLPDEATLKLTKKKDKQYDNTVLWNREDPSKTPKKPNHPGLVSV